MRASQRNEPFEEPARDIIPDISRGHVAAMEASDADAVWIGAGMHQLLLRTIGRRSGREHKVALPFWYDDADHRVVVGSFAGAAWHPSWYLNLIDRTANPEVYVKVQIRIESSDRDYEKEWTESVKLREGLALQAQAAMVDSQTNDDLGAFSRTVAR